VYALSAWVRASGENTQRVIAQTQQEETERQRRAALSPADSLREDFAGMSADAPLWVIIAGLPDEADAEARTLIVDRALRVPSFDAELERTINADWPRYRHACAELIRLVPAEAIKASWGGALARAITISASEIEKDRTWFAAREDRNPDPIGHVRAHGGRRDATGRDAGTRRGPGGAVESDRSRDGPGAGSGPGGPARGRGAGERREVAERVRSRAAFSIPDQIVRRTRRNRCR
jgi:hypothetical protein